MLDGIWNKRVTDERFKEAWQNNQNLDNAALGRILGLSRETVRDRKALIMKRGWVPEFDPATAGVQAPYIVNATSELIDAEGNTVLKWLKTRLDDEKRMEMIAEACKNLAKDLPQIPKRECSKTKKDSQLNTAYIIADAHLGMMAWEPESGQDWDIKIAETNICTIFDDLHQRAPASQYATIANLGDYFHKDNKHGVTTRSGNILTSDSRYPKMAETGLVLMKFAIEKSLKKHEFVEVFNIEGNHDDIGAIWLNIALSHIYEKNERVIIRKDDWAAHKYMRFGKNLIGMTHGQESKLKDLPLIMATDRAQDWGETLFREWWTGHIHHEKTFEYPGCTSRSFGTAAPKDDYSAAKGYRSKQNMRSIVLHSECGPVSEHISNALTAGV